MTQPIESGSLDQNVKNEGRFAIDLLPIVDQSDKYSYISNLSVLVDVSRDKLKEFELRNGYNNNSFDYAQSPLKFFKGELNKNGYNSSSIYPEDLQNCGIRLFQAKSIEIIGDIISIVTTDNQLYRGTFEGYITQGLNVLELCTTSYVQMLKSKSKQTQKITMDGSLLQIRSKQLLNIGADDYCITDNVKNQLCILVDNKIALYEYDDDSINRLSDYFDLSIYGEVKNIRTDENSNFYFIISKSDGESKLRVLNRKTLEEVMSFKDLTEIVYLSSETGKLFCMDKDGYLRIVTINVKNLPRGYVDTNSITAESTASNIIKIEDKPRSDLKNLLSSGGISLSHAVEEVIDETGKGVDDSQLREQLWQTPFEDVDNGKAITLRQLYNNAKSPKEIDAVYFAVQQLKKNPHVTAVKGLMDPIVAAVNTKREKIKLAGLSEQLAQISKELMTVTDFAGMITLKSELTKIRHARSQILLVDKETDLLLKETLGAIDQKIVEYQDEHKEQLTQEIDKNCARLTEYMQGIDYLPQITSVYSAELWKQTEQMLGYLTDEDRKLYKKKMADIVSHRQNELTKRSKEEQKSGLQQQEERVNEIKNKLVSLKGILESINDEDSLKTMEMSDALVLLIKDEVALLPDNKGQELHQKLEQLFKERMLSIQFTKDSAVGTLKTLDQYGVPKSLYFVPDLSKKVKREISAKSTKDGQFRLMFVSSTGNILEPSINKKILGNFKFTYTFSERQELKKQLSERNSNGTKAKYKALKEEVRKSPEDIEAKKKLDDIAATYYVPRMLEVMNGISGEGNLRDLTPRKNLPSIDNRTVITATIQESLAKWGRILSQQLQYKQGIMIVESEAGTGKNFKCDILGHLTNREIFDVSCNEYMEKEDLLFSPEIDNDGTHRKASKLVQGLQTPGAIIVLDEINTLKPGVSKLLNPLLDSRRYINDPQMGRIYAHPSVIIVGLMNPRYYRGTKELSQEFVSRARMTNDRYPEPQEEAFMISRYLDGALGKLSQDEFDHYWEEYIVKNQRPTDRTIYNVFVGLHVTVKVAKKIREVYSSTMKGDGSVGEELNFVFTIRDGNYVVQDFNHTGDIKQSLKDVVLPKISDLDQKKFAEELTDRTV